MGTPRHWAEGRHEIALGKENRSPHPLPRSHIKASCSSSLCPVLCSKIFLLQPQSLGYKMMALASLNSKDLSSTAFCFVSFWVLPPDLPLPCPLPPAPISLTPSPAMRKLIEGEMGVEPENMAFTPRLKMFDLREKVSKQSPLLFLSGPLAFCDHVSAHEPWNRPHSALMCLVPRF